VEDKIHRFQARPFNKKIVHLEKGSDFSVPIPAGMRLTKHSLAGNNLI
jgi:hypothetical protein